MDSKNHVTEILAAYALNILDATEAAHVEAHLAVCTHCQEELAAYQEVTGLLAFAAPVVTPSPAAKQRLLLEIENSGETAAAPPTQQDSKWHLWRNWFEKRPIWQPVLVLLILLLFISNFQLRQKLVDASHPATFGTVTLSGTEISTAATGLIIVSADGQHGTLIVQDLPILQENETYQAWLIKEGQTTSGAVFNVNEDGYRAVWLQSSDPLASYNSFAVTIEPAEGSPAPTGEKVLSN